MNTSPKPTVRPVPKNKEKRRAAWSPFLPLEVVQPAAASVCPVPHPSPACSQGLPGSPAPLPVRLRGKSAAGIFHLTLQPCRLSSDHYPATDTRRVGQASLQGLDLLSPGFCSAAHKGRSGFRAPGTLHPASAQACFVLASCSLISFGFPSGRLLTLPKPPPGNMLVATNNANMLLRLPGPQCSLPSRDLRGRKRQDNAPWSPLSRHPDKNKPQPLQGLGQTKPWRIVLREPSQEKATRDPQTLPDPFLSV